MHQAALPTQTPVLLVIDASYPRRPLALGLTSPIPLWSAKPIPQQQRPVRVRPSLRMGLLAPQSPRGRLTRKAWPDLQVKGHLVVRLQDQVINLLTTTSQSPTSHSTRMLAAARQATGRRPLRSRPPSQPVWDGPTPSAPPHSSDTRGRFPTAICGSTWAKRVQAEPRSC